MITSFPILEGFDHYATATGGTNGAMDTEWNMITSSPVITIPGIGGDGQCIHWGAGAALGHMNHAFTPDSKLSFAFGIKILNLSANSQAEFLTFSTAGGSHQFGLMVNLAGNLQLIGEGGLQVAVSDAALLVNQTYRIACYADIVAGTFHCSINGTVDAGLSHTGLDINDDPAITTAGLLSNGMMCDGFGGRNNTYNFDDLILGIGDLIDFGPQQITTLPATSDVTTAWTRSTGANNYANVDDLPFTADTDYNSSSTVGAKDCFGYADPVTTPDQILAVSLMTVARKEESAVRKFREFLRIGASDYAGTEHNTAESYGRWISTWQTNPATASAWLPAEIIALTGGYELTEVD